MAHQFVVGFWESQVNKLNRELVEEFEEYLPTLFDLKSWRKTPQLRTIPVKQSISVQHEVIALRARRGVGACARELRGLQLYLPAGAPHPGEGLRKAPGKLSDVWHGAETVARTAVAGRSAVKRLWKSSSEQRRPD